MKRVFFLSMLFTVTVALGGCATSPGSIGGGHARIRSLSGDAEVAHAGTNWEPAHLWEKLHAGDQARTGGNGQIDFSMGRYGGVLTLMPESLIEFQQIGPASPGDRIVGIIDLREGRVVGDTLNLPKGTRLQVKTRDGVHEIP